MWSISWNTGISHESSRSHPSIIGLERGIRVPQIRDAVESIFDVKVLKVNTLNREGKRKRNRGLPTFGKRPDVKRAYVTLVEGESIELFEV